MAYDICMSGSVDLGANCKLRWRGMRLFHPANLVRLVTVDSGAIFFRVRHIERSCLH